MRDTGVHAGAVFLLARNGQTLRLEVTAGLPAGYLAPWFAVGLSSPAPVAEAVRERRLVWLGQPQEFARRYPHAAIALPYHYAAAVAPLLTGTTAGGALLLLWPGSDMAGSAGPSPEQVTGASRGLGQHLRAVADTGHPIGPGALPRTLPRPTAGKREPAEALAAAEFAERLPEGSCSLDLEGKFTYVSATAAEQIGGSVPELIGTRPWDSLPWCADPAFEDRYRAAVLSQKPGYFTALRPPDRWLAFELYPDASGVSVRISPADPADPTQAAPPTVRRPQGEPISLGENYQVLHLAAALSQALDVDDVVDLVSDELMLAYRTHTVALLAAEDGRMRILSCRGCDLRLLEGSDGAPLTSPTPAARVLATGTPSFFATYDELARAHPGAPRQDDVHAYALLPLIAGGHPVGSCVLAFDRPHPFSHNQRAVLTVLAGLIAQALERARLYDTSNELAQTLQAALLPDALPDLPGLDVAARYLPSVRTMDIGGDFYDLVPVGDSAVAALIGDVEGHNAEAAALMGRIRYSIRSHAASGATPEQALAQANRRLVDLDPGRFASCLYAHLDLARRQAVLATAGHPPPILRRPDGHAEALSLSPGLLLGIDPDADYPSTEIPLERGSVLALYTDGLVETPGVDPDDALAGLAAQLTQAPPQPMDRLATALIDHARQTAPRMDDIALLLICLTAG
ncbi:SpoIIE family protein phosphatase [Streptomyces sp. NPDC019507]|uniref:SpoIIE family protein phosphatase n=1 Tax=Streptomyces sp. NPDC019507 TaxID=3154689 RepID=UPI0033E12C27